MDGLKVILRSPIEDARGSFARLFCARELGEIGLQKPIAQINYSITLKKGAVRGMHYQLPPHAETKIVMCLRGRAFDVAVDLRQDSKTFLRWHGIELSPGNRNAFCIPEGFAHGFQTLEDDTELLYLHTEYYSQPVEGALNAADPRLGIAWPLSITEISERDRSHAFLSSAFTGIRL
ncbi:MAG: dTDP-4-dehydrorhamnose 3,5-epimerase family protein [Fibrobacterota bacterium]|nr:dTDP-4-dehydrorhamnose 3,5-epimerase family protein [Fibrobacterota bacterium]